MKIVVTDVLPYLAWLGSIILFILSWVRFRKKDAGTADKLKAEASVLITDGALRIVERLSKDLDEAREQIEKLLVIADELKQLHEKTKVVHAEQVNELNKKLKETKDLIDIKKRHCIQTKARIMKLHELLSMKQGELTQEQLQDFITKITDLLNSGYDEDHIDNVNYK